MKKVILESDFKKWKDLITQADMIESSIINRICYILTFWLQTFGNTLSSWYFEGADEGHVGDLDSHISDSVIYGIVLDYFYDNKTNIIDKHGNNLSCDDDIPTRWLFEDFEEEIVNGKKLFEDKMAAKKAAAFERKKVTKEQRQALIDGAKSKLTKEELKAIRGK